MAAIEALTKRFVFAVFVTFGVATLVFFLAHMVPGDPVDVMLGHTARAADKAALRRELGLDQPVVVQYGHYVSGLVRLDLGNSIHSGRAVSNVVANRLGATGFLAFLSMLITLAIALPAGILAATKRGSPFDTAIIAASSFGLAIPNFCLGPLLILVFSVALGWFPVSGHTEPLAIVLPALTLSTGFAAVLARMIRSSLLETLPEDFIRTARAKGLSNRIVLVRHALRNSLLPVLTLFGLQIGALFAGAIITETIFSWPGIGSLTIEAIQKRDYPVLQGCVLTISIGYVLANAIVDGLYLWADPRVRDGKPA